MKIIRIIIFLVIVPFQTFAQNFHISAFFQPNIAYKFDNDYLSKIEKPMFGYQTGFEITYNINDRLGIASGISFYKKGYRTKSTLFYRDVYSSEPKELNVSYNYFFIGMPFIVKYTIVNFKNLRLCVNAGVIGNVFLSETINREFVYSDYTDKSTYKSYGNKNTRNINAAGSIGFTADIPITEEISLSLQPNYESLIWPFVKNNHFYTRKFWDLGLRVGLSYKL